MAMVETHVSAHESVAGRYRPMEVAHRETNRVSWYGEDMIDERPCLLTQVTLPAAPDGESAGRITAGIRRTTDVMVLLCPTRVAPVVDAVEEAGTLWTVTDWIDGTPLGQLLAQQGTFHYVRAARIGLELLDILESAHSEGITHGELSPGQVFVRDQGGIVLTGFGLAGATLAPGSPHRRTPPPNRPGTSASVPPPTCGRWARSSTRWSRDTRRSATGAAPRRP
jgi:serine/threonine protein kinase